MNDKIKCVPQQGWSDGNYDDKDFTDTGVYRDSTMGTALIMTKIKNLSWPGSPIGCSACPELPAPAVANIKRHSMSSSSSCHSTALAVDAMAVQQERHCSLSNSRHAIDYYCEGSGYSLHKKEMSTSKRRDDDQPFSNNESEESEGQPGFSSSSGDDDEDDHRDSQILI
jgi:hypothetical protein